MIIIPCKRECWPIYYIFTCFIYELIFTKCLLKRKGEKGRSGIQTYLFPDFRNHSLIYHWHFWMYILYQWKANQHQGDAASQPPWPENQLGMQAFVVKPCFKPVLLETHNRIFFLFLYLLLTAGGLKLPELSSLIITFEK